MKIKLKEACSNIRQYFSPRIVGEVNDHYVKVAKIKGQDVPWHNHQNEDELFYVVEGTLLMEIESRPGFTLGRGELFVVKKGLNHRVSSAEECLIMLIEPKATAHTGNVITAITKSVEEQR